MTFLYFISIIIREKAHLALIIEVERRAPGSPPVRIAQIHREGKTIVRQLDAARNQLGNLLLHHEGWEGQLLDIGNQLCTLIVDVAAICTDDGSNADVRAFLTAAEVTLPEKFLTES